MTNNNFGPEQLHAPWRMEYIEKAGKPSDGCIFCEKPCQSTDLENCLLYRGEHCFIILNAFPYNSGHLMVVPYLHAANLAEVPLEVQAEMMQLATLAIKALTRVMHPDGFNLGMNLGHAGGAGIAEHVHLHVVPRWVGDTNFITVIGNTRVLPEPLERTWSRVCAAIQQVLAEEA